MSVSRFNYALVLTGAGLLFALTTQACGSSGDSDSSGSGANGSGAASSGGSTSSSGGSISSTGGSINSGGTTNTGGTGDLATDLCGTEGCKCSNGIDDDKDGKADDLDPECTGPLDNDEATFATGIPGDNQDPKWQDCFFDGNSGAGDDDCRYATECLYGQLPQTHPDCTVSEQCKKFCGDRTPNGCDCFGCCTVSDGKGNTYDVISQLTSCSADKLADEKACPRCTKTTSCGNTCGECELCPGKTIEDLDPVKCAPPSGSGGAGGSPGTAGAAGTPGTPVPTCEGGIACGSGLPNCPSSYYCNLGCCLPSIR